MSLLETILLERLALLTSQRPRLVLLFWLGLLLAAIPLARQVGSVLSSDPGDAPGSRARAVSTVIQERFAAANSNSLILIADAKPGAADAGALERQWQSVLREFSASPSVMGLQVPDSNPVLPGFDDGSSEPSRTSVAVLELRAESEQEALAAHQELLELLPADGPANYALTGEAAVNAELQEISERDALRAELIGLSISLLVLMVVFGAVVASVLPLIMALVSITLSMAALFLVGQALPIATFAQSMVTLLGLATGIDYALLMVNRYREELAAGGEAHSAAYRTMLSAGKAVAVSGLTVLVALSALLIPPLEFIRSIGLASIIVMFFSVLASVTALPALLALLGKRVNALQLSRREPGTRSRSFWQSRAEVVMRRPLAWTVFGTLVLLTVSLPAFSMKLGISGVEGLTENTTARQAFATLERVGLANLQQSLDVLVDYGEGGFYHPSAVRGMAELTREAQELVGSSQLFSPTTVSSLPSLLMYQYYASAELAAESPLRNLARSTVSQDGRYGLLRIYPADNNPASIDALVRELRQSAGELGLRATVGGRFVADQEWTQTLYRTFPYAVLFVYVATFVLLGLAFRSLVIPLKSILLNTLTVMASFGVITAVFQNGWLAQLFGVPGGLGFVETSVPIFIFAVVFGLSMDYEVFLVSRIVEGHQQGMDDRSAVMHALSSTGSVITSAALVMVVVFAAFIFSHIVLIKTLSLGLSVAVLLDATLVRLALVPAVMLLTRDWNWWFPRPLARLAKRVDLGHD